MSAFAEEHGFRSIILSEHHCAEDGHLPSPLPLAGAIGGRTRQIAISISALLAPLYDPVRLAEDIAVLDLATGGRLSITLGLGYREIEYHATRKEFRRRGALFDEVIETLLKAWSGAPFDYHGQRIRVTPRPFTQPHPLIVIGGSNPISARRAARYGLPFGPPLSDPALNQLYRDECTRLGVANPLLFDPGEPFMVFVSDDPEHSWREIGPHWLHDATDYASWQRDDQRSYQLSSASTVEALRAEGKYRIWTPEQYLAETEARGPGTSFTHFPLGGGIPPALGWKSLELFAARVAPHLSR
jgi:alkanesulfonate monooxygenase SsuD/methylene tetrahydromethanopterin reductase-like flavin-dependent oxidoreductase (luciferase family)